ncbi:putative uncharacterized protein [Firmicutes bacterium CAG:822]|mgnify:CR=1 FL=1|nr:putative uncharacterized protein [Firmicutes bacterium CAG:822]
MGKLGLVLSGGGSKGAYEIGVYAALRHLKKDISIVTGTSVGAINGVFVVQKDLKGALKFWDHVNFKTIFDEEEFPPIEDEKLSKIYIQYAKGFINEGGLDIYKMKNIFDDYFKASRFYNSNIDYGLVTYNFSKNKPVIKTKKDLTKENIKDYVLASASCYPAFKPYLIDGEMHIDGGYYDNLPINLAIDLGATEIIAVDLRAIGFKKSIKDKTVDIIYISPRNKIGSFLVFDKVQARRAIKLGFNDTMKTFNKLEGNKFTFRRYNLVKNYNKYIDRYELKLNDIFKHTDSKLLNKVFHSEIFKDILNNKILYNNFNNLVEVAGKMFNFDESTIYHIRSYNKGLLTALSNTPAVELEEITANLKNKKLENIIDRRKIVKYFYNQIEKGDISFKYVLPFSNEFLVALYIYTIKTPRSIY